MGMTLKQLHEIVRDELAAGADPETALRISVGVNNTWIECPVDCVDAVVEPGKVPRKVIEINGEASGIFTEIEVVDDVESDNG